MSVFENKVCPMCGKVLTLKIVAGVNVYSCPTTFELPLAGGTKLKTHYEVESEKNSTYQHMYLIPWAIDNFGNSAKSRVYKINDKYIDGAQVQIWKLIAEVPQIHADTEENLRNRINTLVPFL